MTKVQNVPLTILEEILSYNEPEERIEILEVSKSFNDAITEVNKKQITQWSKRSLSIPADLKSASWSIKISHVYQRVMSFAERVGFDVKDIKNPIDNLPLILQKVEETENSLLIFFWDLLRGNPILNPPQPLGSVAEKARIYRDWMSANETALNLITELDLSGSDLVGVPQEIKLFKNLIVLNLEDTQLRVLPYLGLEHLEYLHLDNTPIRALPKLNLPNLYSITLSGTQITFLPELELPGLHHLWADNTLIEAISEKLKLPSLRFLFLEGAQITELPALEFPCLKKLVLYRAQKITTIPVSFNQAQLKKLDIRDTSIKELANCFNRPDLTIFSDHKITFY